jgi:hypothetical protein
MTLLLRAPAALLKMDALTVSRPAATVDADGNPDTKRTAVSSVTRGTWSQLSMKEISLAATRGTTVNAALGLALGADVQAGDFVAVRGLLFEVMAVDDRRLHRRALLRAITDK